MLILLKLKKLKTSKNYESPATPSTPIRSKIFDVPDSSYVFDEEITREFMVYDTDNGIEGLIAILKEKGHE